MPITTTITNLSRVYEPSLRSISRYVCRAFARFDSGASAVSSSIMRSRSETQYQVAASVKKIATTASVAL
jgi:hypothetical protein